MIVVVVAVLGECAKTHQCEFTRPVLYILKYVHAYLLRVCLYCVHMLYICVCIQVYLRNKVYLRNNIHY